jgi:hypothetical protein
MMSKKAGGNAAAHGGSGLGISGVMPFSMRDAKMSRLMLAKGTSQNASSQNMMPSAYMSVEGFGVVP